jgi:hypothetical protein
MPPASTASTETLAEVDISFLLDFLRLASTQAARSKFFGKVRLYISVKWSI